MPSKQGYLIELEGGDGAGKRTQAGLLRDRLVEAGWEVLVFSFPDDETPYGKLIREALNSKHGDFLHADPCLSSALYIADRGLRVAEIRAALGRDAVVICDRWVASNLAYQGAKIADRADRDAFQDWCEGMECEQLGHPRPDIVLFLDIPPTVGQQLVDQRGKDRDQHEIDIRYLDAVYAEFRVLAKRRGWSIIQCLNGQSKLADPETIHRQIWGVAHTFLD